MPDIDPDTPGKTARGVLDARIEAVRTLAARRAELTRARDAVTAADKAGWTESELRPVGFSAPARRAPAANSPGPAAAAS